MSSNQFIVKPGDRCNALTVIGTNVTVLVSDKDSDDQQITLQSGDEGTGPPPHNHDWEESFYVTKGQVQFTCSGQTTILDREIPPGPPDVAKVIRVADEYGARFRI